MNLLYTFYKSLSIAFQLCAPFILRLRLIKGKELKSRFHEKLGYYNIPRPPGRLIWYHVASVGELNSILPLLKKFTQIRPDLKFLITSITVGSFRVFEKASLENCLHQFAPIDCPRFVKRFLRHWHPDLGIFVDSEMWPNLIISASKELPLLMVNGRLSDSSHKKWQYFRGFAKYLYNRFKLIMPTSKDDENKISSFANTKIIKNIGNLKYGFDGSIQYNDAATEQLKSQISGRPCWIAASTHDAEQEDMINCHVEAAKKVHNLLTIIAPRHITKVQTIVDAAKKRGLNFALRSKEEKITEETAIYIADTLGELNRFYSITDIAFVGGSLFPHGGHNILEPARFGNAVLAGRYTHNFRDIINDFKNEGTIIEVNNARELSDMLVKLLLNSDYKNKLGKKALNLTMKNSNVIDKAISEISNFIP